MECARTRAHDRPSLLQGVVLRQDDGEVLVYHKLVGVAACVLQADGAPLVKGRCER